MVRSVLDKVPVPVSLGDGQYEVESDSDDDSEPTTDDSNDAESKT